MTTSANPPEIQIALPGWAECDIALSKFAPPESIGFSCRPGDLNRLASRYRLAKSFRGINLEAYSHETAAGYSSIFETFLAYSALDQYLDCASLKLSALKQSLELYDRSTVDAAIRTISGHSEFLRSVYGHLDREHQRQQFDDFLSGKEMNTLFLAAGVRHIFAHGKLTPSAGAGDSTVASSVCRHLTDFTLRVLEGEFYKRLKISGIVA